MVNANSPPLERIEAILEKAVNTYDMLCTVGICLPNMSKGGRAINSLVQQNNTCWNCGETGHSVDKCQKPKDQGKIAKNHNAFYDNEEKMVLLVAAVTPTMEKVMVKAARAEINPVLSIRGRSGRQMRFTWLMVP